MMYVELAHQSEKCDKCAKTGENNNPVLYLQVSTRRDKQVIFVHSKCLLKFLNRINSEKVTGSS